METVISSLATVRLHSTSRLLPSACCPDKDLIVLVTNDGVTEKMSLWKVQGSKKWEVDITQEGNVKDEIAAVTWGPDGQTILVAHHPPRLSWHSFQNGQEEKSFSLVSGSSSPRITGAWWFKKAESETNGQSFPDIFGRGNVITGSAHSVLRMLPLLDALQDDTVPLTATDLFAFQGSQTRPAPKPSALPEHIRDWPALPPDPLAASVETLNEERSAPGEDLDVKDYSNVDSILVVSDAAGQVHLFLDGTYPLGRFQIHPSCNVSRVYQAFEGSKLFVNAHICAANNEWHNLVPLVINFPLLQKKATRHIAESSTSARELLWYVIRVIKDMRRLWFGVDGHDGARSMNSNWAKGLEERQVKFNLEANATLDLTRTLLTGKASDALIDYLSSGEQTSERGLQKWETTVSDALSKLREFSERRVAPACQRLHLILEEVKGWSSLPQLYGEYGFVTAEVDECLELTARAIVIAAWLAATARRELARFAEFITFLRAETAQHNRPQGDAYQVLPPRHDILEVNEFLMSGLVVSSVDRWFIGPVPQFSMQHLTGMPVSSSLHSVMEQARQLTEDPSKLTWPPITKTRDLSHLDRNLDALVNALLEKCWRIFDRAAQAVAHTAKLDPGWYLPQDRELNTSKIKLDEMLVRDRIENDGASEKLVEYVLVCLRGGDKEQKADKLCLIRVTYRYTGNSRTIVSIACTVADCRIQWDTSLDEEEGEDLRLLDADFFDEQSVVIVFERCGKEGMTGIAMVDYSELGYQEMDVTKYVNAPSREELVMDVMEGLDAGQIATEPIRVRKQKELQINVGEEGRMSICVNGRAGRRTVCVLGGDGMELEMLDMEGEGGEDPEDEEGEEGEEG